MSESTITSTVQWSDPVPVMLDDTITYTTPENLSGQTYTVTFDV